MPDDDLLARIERLEEDNRRLSELVGRLSAPGTPEPDDSPVNRRGLLKRTAAVALGVTAVGAAGQLLSPTPAAAADGSPIIAGQHNTSNTPTSYTCFSPGNPAITIYSQASDSIGLRTHGIGIGLHAMANNQAGIVGQVPISFTPTGLTVQRAGVAGVGSSAHGVFGISDNSVGVVGQCDRNIGVYGTGKVGVRGDGTTSGVAGGSVDGDGVFGSSAGGNGVFGRIYQANSRANAGVYGMALAPVNQRDLITSAGVVGESRDYPGVQGASTANNGVVGVSESARGGVFSGGAAAVQLKPGSLAAPPAAGQTGDLYVDSTGRLWYCRQGGGTASWVTLAG